LRGFPKVRGVPGEELCVDPSAELVGLERVTVLELPTSVERVP